ncbi:hypothetical protein F5876DRAFT_83806 [Lentinula aff. lateritia]|uniref:Uncharacterized protein n=1 Tax=Lentinula aff. lateritia TaxID=2804960 RepID=A0ACC1TH97_9AGAR|nr:hypothetical protein F5876DRAFT_83806 [Lentinula aff. lateritia]
MSDINLRERFYSALLPEIRQNLITVNIGQGVAQTLKEAITRAVSVDVYLHDPTLTGRNVGPTRSYVSPAGPHAMDINATHTSNGNTREAFLARMWGQCFGCGAQATTRSLPSSVAVPVAPFELQPAPSTLQHKLLIPKPTLRPILTQVLQPRRQQISATGSTPFSLFPNESVQIAASTAPSALAAVPTTPSPLSRTSPTKLVKSESY